MVGTLMTDRFISLRLPQAYVDALDSHAAEVLGASEREPKRSIRARSLLVRIAIREFFERRNIPIPSIEGEDPNHDST